MKTVYFAGKVSKGGGYRGQLLGDPSVMSNGNKIYEVGGGKLIYGGPFALSCDHACFHREGRHGLLNAKYSAQWPEEPGCFEEVEGDDCPKFGSTEHGFSWGFTKDQVVNRCTSQITACDAVHCYLDNISCYGTLVELGWAASDAKPIYIYYAEKVHNWDKHLWFAMSLPGITHCGPGTPISIHPDLITKEKTYKERYHEYLFSPEWDLLRKAKLKEAGHKCQLCNASGVKIEVHHRTYERVFHELLEDLIALCDPCHKKFHDRLPALEL